MATFDPSRPPVNLAPGSPGSDDSFHSCSDKPEGAAAPSIVLTVELNRSGDCAICYDPLPQGDELSEARAFHVVKLSCPCNRALSIFHKQCLLDWANSDPQATRDEDGNSIRSFTCPGARHTILARGLYALEEGESEHPLSDTAESVSSYYTARSHLSDERASTSDQGKPKKVLKKKHKEEPAADCAFDEEVDESSLLTLEQMQSWFRDWQSRHNIRLDDEDDDRMIDLANVYPIAHRTMTPEQRVRRNDFDLGTFNVSPPGSPDLDQNFMPSRERGELDFLAEFTESTLASVERTKQERTSRWLGGLEDADKPNYEEVQGLSERDINSLSRRDRLERIRKDVEALGKKIKDTGRQLEAEQVRLQEVRAVTAEARAKENFSKTMGELKAKFAERRPPD